MIGDISNADMFQFHTGSIKRGVEKYGILRTDLFQFHTGSIKSILERNLEYAKFNVSIPHWFD